jgi:hypothetical protein
MIDENGNRCADPKPKIIIENGTAWLRTKDGRLHFIGDREQLFQHAAHALRKLEGWHRREVYQPPEPRVDHPSAFDV